MGAFLDWFFAFITTMADGLWMERREVIKKTYQNAIVNGDKYIAFLDGELLWGEVDRDSCTVDGCHPNDLGFYRMAETIYPVLKELINRK